MNEFKNPVFLVEILNEILKNNNNIYAVFAGKGDLEMNVMEKAKELGIQDYIRVLGWRDDTATLMKSSDIFIFPRKEYPKEGLGLVVVEAQAAGLAMILSYGIVKDAVVVKELAHFISFNNNPGEWAELILKIINNAPAISKEKSLELVQQSDFELKKGTANLLAIYEN
jgi:glycosyltransferase involved in cell wall biosynthesis